MLQFLLPLSLAHALRNCVYGELDHPLSTVISGPWTAVSGGSDRQRVDYGCVCTTVHTYLSPLSAASVGSGTGTGDLLSLLIANGNDHAGRKLQTGGALLIPRQRKDG